MENEVMAKIKKDFEDGAKHSVLTALRKFGTTELRRIVSRLKKKGLNIISERHRSDNGKYFNVYALKK